MPDAVQVYEGSGEAPPANYVFRAMKIDGAGKPIIGRSKRCLGVVVDGDPANLPGTKPDVHPVNNSVSPVGEGMSVALSTPWNLPDHRRPSGYWQGTGRDRVFELRDTAVAGDLSLHPDNRTHAVIEPAKLMQLQQYEAALTATRPLWAQVEEPA